MLKATVALLRMTCLAGQAYTAIQILVYSAALYQYTGLNRCQSVRGRGQHPLSSTNEEDDINCAWPLIVFDSCIKVRCISLVACMHYKTGNSKHALLACCIP